MSSAYDPSRDSPSHSILTPGNCHTFKGLSAREMHGLRQIMQNPKRGLIPRVLDYIYDKYTSNPEMQEKLDLTISYLEIYNDQVTDLLEVEATQQCHSPDFT